MCKIACFVYKMVLSTRGGGLLSPITFVLRNLVWTFQNQDNKIAQARERRPGRRFFRSSIMCAANTSLRTSSLSTQPAFTVPFDPESGSSEVQTMYSCVGPSYICSLNILLKLSVFLAFAPAIDILLKRSFAVLLSKGFGKKLSLPESSWLVVLETSDSDTLETKC